MIVTEQDPRLLAWAQHQLDMAFQPGARWIANVDDTGILCVVVYQNWHRTGCEMAIASSTPRWASRAFLRAGFAYPFEQLGLQRVTFVTSAWNYACITLCRRLGAVKEGELRRYYSDGSNAVIYGLFHEELPAWILGGKHAETDDAIARAA